MKAGARASLIAVPLFLFAFVALAATPAQQVSASFLDNLQVGHFEDAHASLAPAAAQALSTQRLARVWKSLIDHYGPLTRRGAPEETHQGNAATVITPLYFANGELRARMVLDADAHIASLRFQPHASAAPAPPPAENAPFTEQDFAVGDLPGTLVIPKGTGPFPAVVLVPGSGPQDRDETIGPNKPFLDLARGLAEHRIAVLRYDKRSYDKPKTLAGTHLTVDNETTNDAIAAVAALASAARIDAGHIYVVGHSQGGLLAPRIAARSGKVAGIVLWSAPARPLLDLVREQNITAMSRDGQLSSEDKQRLAGVDMIIASIRASHDDQSLPGAPAAYWRELDRVDPRAELRQARVPVLEISGGRDFQVSTADAVLWKQTLASHSNATTLNFPTLNHLGMPGTGPSSLAEYQEPNHVAAQLIDGIATWIHRQAR